MFTEQLKKQQEEEVDSRKRDLVIMNADIARRATSLQIFFHINFLRT